MLIAIVLDRPLAEAKALVEAPDAFIQAITRIMQDKQNHPVIAQMIRPGVSDDLPSMECPVHHHIRACLDDSPNIPQPAQGKYQKRQLCQHNRSQVDSPYLV